MQVDLHVEKPWLKSKMSTYKPGPLLLLLCMGKGQNGNGEEKVIVGSAKPFAGRSPENMIESTRECKLEWKSKGQKPGPQEREVECL